MPLLQAVSNYKASAIVILSGYEKEVPMRTIHVYRAARKYFVDGIYWGDDEEGVRFYLRVTGVPPDAITKALGEFRKRFSCVRVSLRSGSSRYVKPDPVGEVMSCACKTLRVYSVSHSIRRKSPIYAWLHLR
jgi:hypothetical protein